MSPTSTSMKAARRLADPFESLAMTVMRSFPEATLEEVREHCSVDTKTGEHSYEFSVLVDNGEHMPEMTATVTLRRPLNEECVASAKDENGTVFGPAALVDVLDMVTFEHGGSHPNLVWLG